MSNVLVTGTSSGFGFLTAKSLVEQEHTVFATMREPTTRNAEPAAALRDAATGKPGTLHARARRHQRAQRRAGRRAARAATCCRTWGPYVARRGDRRCPAQAQVAIFASMQGGG